MKQNLALFALCCLLLAACNPVSIPVALSTPVLTSPPTLIAIPTQRDSKCISPLTTFVYPNGETTLLPSPQEPVLPPADWAMISKVKYNHPASLSLEVIQSHNGYDELWILSNNNQGVFRYRTDTQEWRITPSTTPNAPFAFGSFLFLDNSRSVWAARRWPKTLSITGDFSLLVYYNEASDQFEPVTDKDGLLQDSDSLAIEALEVSQNGIFWMIIKELDSINFKEIYYLYSFDPIALKAERHLTGPQFSSNIVISPNGDIFMLDLSRGKLIEFHPSSGETKEYGIPDPELSNQFSATIFLDSKSRLWVNDIGWFDFSSADLSPQWFTVIRSPVFIDVIEGAGVWSWGYPVFTYESSDALLWFWSSRGTGWLDTQYGEWCLFTTYRSPVLEDSSGRLWMLADDTLYMKNR
ncbi:MAG: hypothetical protein ACOYZ8_01540 [Chloroflexota bacterium]